MLVSHEMSASRPTCETCVHWCSLDQLEGMCCRFPRTCFANGTEKSPYTDKMDWCGEHPDFPAWLADLRASQGEPPLKQAIDYGSPSYSRPVECLGLDARARKMAKRMNIQTVGDLVRKRADELLECRNFGMTSLTLVRAALAKQGMRLHGD